jgi:putative ABC transport system permease protein
MVGIVIGIVTVTLMGAFLIGMNDMFHSTFSFMGTDVYYVDKFDWGSMKWYLMRNRPEVTQEEATALRQRLTSAMAVSVKAGQWMLSAKYKAKSIDNASAVGVDESYATAAALDIAEGRFLSTAELLTARPVCLIGGEIADKLFQNESPVGKQMRIGGYPVEIVGVIKKVGGMFGAFTSDNQVIMPLKTFFAAFGDPHRSVTIAVKAKSVESKLETKSEVIAVMRQIRRLKPSAEDNFGINSEDMFNQMFDSFTVLFGVIGFIITGLSLLVGGIGIMNIMFVTVKERTREIGIRKAVGAKQRSILVQFLAEASMLALFAGLIALAISYLLTIVLDKVLLADSAMHVGFPLPVALLGIILALSVGLLSGLIPAWRASRLDPVDALRYE